MKKTNCLSDTDDRYKMDNLSLFDDVIVLESDMPNNSHSFC